MAFPATLTNAIDDVTEIVAAHLNNLEAKVGIDNSAVPTSLDYLLKNAGSIEPGHKHSGLWASNGSLQTAYTDANGNVGIGTASPGAKLDVLKTGASWQQIANFQNTTPDGYPYISVGDNINKITLGHTNASPLGASYGWISYSNLDPSAGQGIILTSSGNVGIGTTSPGDILHLYKPASDARIRLDIDNGAHTSGIAFCDNADTTSVQKAALQFLSGGYAAIPTRVNSLEFLTNGAYHIAFRPNDSEAMRIISGGNVGIGTTSPGKKLDVSGYVRGVGIFNTLNSAPADGNLTAGECALWFDKTDGAAKLMIKAKQNDGTVKTGSVSLN